MCDLFLCDCETNIINYADDTAIYACEPNMDVVLSKLEKDTYLYSVVVEEARSVDDLHDHVGEDVRNVLPEMGAKEQGDSLDQEEVAIAMEIAEVIERGGKDKLRVLGRNYLPKKKLLEETAKF